MSATIVVLSHPRKLLVVVLLLVLVLSTRCGVADATSGATPIIRPASIFIPTSLRCAVNSLMVFRAIISRLKASIQSAVFDSQPRE